MGDTSQPLYVYGVASAADCGAASAPGVEGAEVHTVEYGGLVALVSPVQSGTLAAAREVRAHWRVLDEACKGATVLPVRFGTVIENEEAVRARLLEPGAERLEHLLRELSGRVQLGVKGDYVEDRLMRDVVSASPAIAELRDHIRTLPDEAGYYERIRLGEMVAAAVGQRRAEDTRLALEALAPLATAIKEEELRYPDSAFNLACLVEREQMDAFGAGVAGLEGWLGDRIALRYVGPLPPYSFADVEFDAGAPAWA